eukprot:477682_1
MVYPYETRSTMRFVVVIVMVVVSLLMQCSGVFAGRKDKEINRLNAIIARQDADIQAKRDIIALQAEKSALQAEVIEGLETTLAKERATTAAQDAKIKGLEHTVAAKDEMIASLKVQILAGQAEKSGYQAEVIEGLETTLAKERATTA